MHNVVNSHGPYMKLGADNITKQLLSPLVLIREK